MRTVFAGVVVAWTAVAQAGSVEPFSLVAKVECSRPSATEEALLTYGPVRFVLRQAQPKDYYDRDLGNYASYRLADGSCPVLEATICEKGGRIGVPLGALEGSQGVHEVVLEYTGVHWTILVDGKVMDDEMPIPKFPIRWDGPLSLVRTSPRVLDAVSGKPEGQGIALARLLSGPKPISRPIQYWTPDDPNAWVGDVTLCLWKDRLHVFYLYDRRHHGSGNWTGRHQFAHLTSDDLVRWQEEPMAVPITEWYESVGTGTAFEYEGKYCLAYGLHTDRLSKDKSLPDGGYYAESEDGVHFRKTGIKVASTRNPSIYNRADGRLAMGGDSVLMVSPSGKIGDWKVVTKPKKSGGDCPSPFEWHGHHYLLQGFHWFDHSTDGVHYEDWSSEGFDIYDGLGVPMVTRWKGDRRILAGWLPYFFDVFGGWLVFRELVWFPDGKLGTKWVPEIVPPGEVREFRVDDPSRAFALRFSSAESDDQLEFRIDPSEKRAQFASVRRGETAPRVKSVKDLHAEFKPTGCRDKWMDCSQIHKDKNDLAIENLRGINGPFTVRICKYFDRKANATVFDAEIAGVRTLVTRRRGAYAWP